jgi:hypothetical protein
MSASDPAETIVKKTSLFICRLAIGLGVAFLPAQALAQQTGAAATATPSTAPASPSAAAPASTMLAQADAAPVTSPAPVMTDSSPRPAAPPSSKTVGGHIGIAFPLVMVEHPTKTIGDRLNIADPIGVTVKLSDNLAVDFEMIVATHIHQSMAPTTLTIDPGVIYNWGLFATGLRAKFDIGSIPNIGVIPLINKGLVDFGGATWFIEAAFPITYVNANVNLDVVIHTGIGF